MLQSEITPVSPRRTRWIVAVSLLLLIVLTALLLPLINLNRYHRDIADSLSRSLGHPVHLGAVNLQLLPLPGLAIQDLTVEEDPSFGAEPLLRAPTVTVYLRLSSLWRARLEISRIHLDQASVNLVRNDQGRWNFSSLLLQAQRTTTAPTAQRRAGSTLRFPYIEFTGARINFKRGYEKRALSFLNADASVWLEDPSRWRIRFEAQPARTDLDLDLEDTGTIRLEGSLTRAASLDQIPLNLHAEWSGAQMGQVSRLMLGKDSGWRGDLRLEADLTGNLNDLQMRSRLRVADAHHIEFTPLNQFDIDARCQAAWHHAQESIDNLTCLWPTGDGHLLLTGSIHTLTNPQPDLDLEINHTPVAFAVNLLGLLRPNAPAALNATGTINGDFHWQTTSFTGHAIADAATFNLNGAEQPVRFTELRFTTPDIEPAVPSTSRKKHTRRQAPRQTMPAAKTILLQPATFLAGAPAPLQLSGQFSRAGFSLHLAGEGSIARLQPLARSIGAFATLTALAPQGTAQTDITLSGPWVIPVNADASTTGITVQGSARLQHAQAKPGWLPEPVEIADATIQFSNGTITWANASASVNGIEAKGSASYPLQCDNPQDCPAQVNLELPTLDLATLQSSILGAGRHGELLEAILSRVESPTPPWPAIKANVHVQTLTLNDLHLSNAVAALAIRDHRLDVLSLDAAALGGSTHITGSVEAAGGGPGYALDLAWTGIKLPEASALFREKWGAGSIDGHAALKLQGYANLATTVTGNFTWTLHGDWNGNALLAPAKKKSKPQPWQAEGSIADQTLTLEKGPGQGTIGFDRSLNLTWTPTAAHIVGTVAHPVPAAAVKPAGHP